MEKTAIALALDEHGLLLPDLVHQALAANERAKYELSLLQTARAYADAPFGPAADLSADRMRAGIEDTSLDSVAMASAAFGGAYRIPGARKIVEAALGHVDAMIAPLRAEPGATEKTTAFERRFQAFNVDDLLTRPDEMTDEALARLTRSDRAERDSLHRLVMDVHKELNALEARLATEAIDGASAFGLMPEDRSLVAAFARGVHRTEALKFDHPGLGTTATRYGGKLVLENDIGATDAHVVVVRVEGNRASLTASDVHVPRIEFLQRLLEPFALRWEDLRARRAPTLNAGEAFYVCTGVFEATAERPLTAFLEALGANLVFLIDWNRARKQLRRFVSNADATGILLAAAREATGHRAFLEAGGEGLVFDAMAAVMRAPVRFGERLDDVLGQGRASTFLRFVLRDAKEARESGRTQALVRERVRAELATELAEAGERLLEPVQHHAAIVHDEAIALSDLLGQLAAGAAVSVAGSAVEAKRREHEADALVVETRRIVERMPHLAAFRRIIESADDATDALEEAAFFVTLFPEDLAFRTAIAEALHPLAEIVVASARAYLTAVESARTATSFAGRAEMRRFLEAVDTVTVLESEADAAERAIVAKRVASPISDARWLTLPLTVAHELEAATDALALAALNLRDHVTPAPDWR